MSKVFIDHFGEEWYELLRPILHTPYFKELGEKVIPRKFSSKVICPDKAEMFKAFKLCPPSKLKAVILGPSPYTEGYANGLAYSNLNIIKISPELNNILKEVEDDIYNGLILDQDPNLTRWAQQGVLLLNTALSTEKDRPGSHIQHWKPFTEFVIRCISDTLPAILYMFWGAYTKQYIPLVDTETNVILTTSHTPKNEEWLGCKHFSKANSWLKEVAIAKDILPEDYTITW
jgi:uracil-DNA glycosylase